MNNSRNYLHCRDCSPAIGNGPRILRPPGFVELIELRSVSMEQRLGYFRSDPVVIFGFCPGGGEVIWKDGHSSGFGTGGWKVFLYEIAPVAARYGRWLGSLESAGTDVLVLDRTRTTFFAASRAHAEAFLMRVYGLPISNRPCLCTRLDYANCSVKTCIFHPSYQPTRPGVATSAQEVPCLTSP